MKVVITQLKAPWPPGAAVGDVVALPGPVLPGWAAGKCTPADDGAEAAFEWAPPPVGTEAEFVVNPAEADDNKAQVAAALLEAAEQELAELRAMVAELVSERDAARAEVEALAAALQEAQQKAAAAAPAPAPADQAATTKKGKAS